MSFLTKLLDRFDFQTAHWDGRVAVALFIVWGIILACAISSIRSQGLSEGQQRFWTGVVILLPVVGLLAYLPFSVKREEVPHYFRFRAQGRPRRAGRADGKKTNPADPA